MVFQCLDLFSYDCSPQPEPSRGLQPNQRQKRNHHSQILPEAYISLRYNKKESDHLAFYLFPSDLTPSNQKEHEKPWQLNAIKIHKPKTMWRFNSFLHNQNLPQAYACMRAKGLAHNHLAFFLWFSKFIFTARTGQNLTPPSDQKEHEKTRYLNEISFKKKKAIVFWLFLSRQTLEAKEFSSKLVPCTGWQRVAWTLASLDPPLLTNARALLWPEFFRFHVLPLPFPPPLTVSWVSYITFRFCLPGTTATGASLF